jgi:hypothetical protein
MALTRWMVCTGLVACASTTPHGTEAIVDPPSDSTYGVVVIGNTDATYSEGTQGYFTTFEVGAQTSALAAPGAALCAGASATVGSCCYVPQVATSTAATEIDLGTIDFTDRSSGAEIYALTFGGGVVVAGSNGAPPSGYADEQSTYPADWKNGDSLLVQGLGDAGYPAFWASVPGFVVPTVTMPTIARAQDMTFSWAPDANAQTMTVLLSAAAANGDFHGEVTCVLPGTSSGVTVDASLTTAFASGDSVWVDFVRKSDRYADLGGGYVKIESVGAHDVPVQLP